MAGEPATPRDVTREDDPRFVRALIENSADMVSVVGADGTLLFHFPPGVLGYEEGENFGRSIADFIHPDDLPGAVDELARAMGVSGVTGPYECRVLAADGTWRWMEFTASNQLEDRMVCGLVLNGHEITKRKAVIEELRKSEERFRSLVQHSNDIIAVIDEMGTVLYASPATAAVLGYPDGALLGTNAFDLVHPDDQEIALATLADAVEHPESHPRLELRIRHADGSWRSIEYVASNQLDDSGAQGVVLNGRDVTDRKQVEQQLAHMAVHDALTGLPNRVLLVDRLDHALARAERDGTTVGVLFMDLDRFKLVNDTRGHAVGDALLEAVARRLRDATRSSDTIARFGGDEFVLVYEDIAGIHELAEVGARLCELMSRPFVVDGAEVYASISIGIAEGHAGCSAEVLLRDADAAMYHAKERGGGTVVTFEDSIRQRANTRFETERALRSAIERDELTLFYQPVVELDTGRVVSMEALLRWNHPERGTVAPAEFIDLAEETGLIVPIGSKVLDTACRQLGEWRGTPGGEQLEVSVNVSAVQLGDADLVDRVRSVLTASGIPPGALNLEITERLLVEDSAACLERLAALKSLGVQLTVDDFGTRYSSLGYLNRMPLDGLKIDRVFVNRLGEQQRDTAIVSAIVAMAHALGISVVAEGVETTAQRDQLLELGCRYAQGFLFAKPASAVDVSTFVRSGSIALS